MKDLAAHFNFYDFFGYLLPGALLTVVTILLAVAIFPDDLESDAAHVETWEAVAFPFIAYLVGHLAQAIAQLTEELLSTRGFLAKRGDMGQNGKALPPELDMLTTNVKQVIDETYQLALPEALHRFQFCDAFVTQAGIATRNNVFMGLAALFRGLLSVSVIAVVCLGVAAVLWFDDNRDTMGWLSAAGALSAVVLIPLSFRRWLHFEKYRVFAVYSDFYIAHRKPTSS